MNLQVLVVSRDQILLDTRQLLLGTFFQVKGAGRMREAETLISSSHFDLIVLCYTLSEDECTQVIDLTASQQPAPQDSHPDRSLGHGRCRSFSAQVSMTEAGPYPLLKKCADLLGIDLREKSRLVSAWTARFVGSHP